MHSLFENLKVTEITAERSVKCISTSWPLSLYVLLLHRFSKIVKVFPNLKQPTSSTERTSTGNEKPLFVPVRMLNVENQSRTQSLLVSYCANKSTQGSGYEIASRTWFPVENIEFRSSLGLSYGEFTESTCLILFQQYLICKAFKE